MLEKFKRMNIRKKLNTGYLIVIIMMVVSGLVSIVGLFSLDNGLNVFVNGSNKADTAVKLCRININIAARNIREAALNDDPAQFITYKTRVEDALASTEAELQALKKTGLIKESLYNQYRDAFTAWATDGYGILDLVESGDSEAAVHEILNTCVPALDNLVEISKELDIETDAMMQKAIKKSTTTYVFGLVSVIVFIVVAAVAALKIAKFIINSITTPLTEIEDATKELTKGNLHTTITYAGTDEIGSVATSLREAIGILSSYVDDIGVAMGKFSEGNFVVQPQVEWKGDFKRILDAFRMFEGKMSETVNSIQQVAKQVSAGAEQVSASSNDLAEGATEQASVTEELAATIETVAEQVAMSAESAGEISRKMGIAGEEIVYGNKKVEEMVHSMDEISRASQEISKIIQTINDIASQTNLLALNASIEAARAGEAGKGFAVVADQVSLLAAQSANAAKESNVLIETSLSAVQSGIVVAGATAEQLKKVVSDSQELAAEVNKAAEALAAQKESFRQINEGVDHINDVVQTNSATSEECAAASLEMTSQANELEQLVHRFEVA